MHTHVKNLFLPWQEKRLSEPDATRVEDHLMACDECRRYFDAVDSMIAPAERSFPTTLVPDPFLPERVKAIAAGQTGSRSDRLRTRLIRPELAIMGAAVAIAVGILIGTESSGSGQRQEQFDLADYYRALSQNGFTANFDSVFTSNRKEPQ